MIDLARLRKALDEWDHGEVRIAADWLIDLADEGSELWAEKPCQHGIVTRHASCINLANEVPGMPRMHLRRVEPFLWEEATA